VKLLYGLALLLYGVLAVSVGLVEGAWPSPTFLLAIVFLQSFIYQGVFVSFIATSMNLCWVKVAATQFAIYMAWANLGRSFGAGAMSALESRLEYNEMFFFIGLTFFVAVALLFRANLAVHRERIELLVGREARRSSPDFAPR
jgi:PAT family beta-lactamase induction signal transducer AmpG